MSPNHSTRDLLIHWSANIALALLWAYFAHLQFAAYRSTGSPLYLLITAVEAVTSILFIIRSPARVSSHYASRWIAALGGTFLPLLARPAFTPGPTALPALFLSYFGAVLVLASLISLWRSFGLVTAQRELRTSGMYHLVRHPMYISHAILLVGYVLGNLSVFNVEVLLVAVGFQVLRSIYEEELWRTDERYQAYAQRVRWRFIPHVY